MHIVDSTLQASLDIAPSVRLDATWSTSDAVEEIVGMRRCVLFDRMTITCAGCARPTPSGNCRQATANPFSCARNMVVCIECAKVLEES